MGGTDLRPVVMLSGVNRKAMHFPRALSNRPLSSFFTLSLLAKNNSSEDRKRKGKERKKNMKGEEKREERKIDEGKEEGAGKGGERRVGTGL